MSAPLVVFGGTFDPFHLGHAYLAARAAAAVGGTVCVLPNGCPPHRQAPAADWQERLAMCRLGVAGMSNVWVSAYETPQRPRPTVATLQHLRRRQPQAALLLLLGADSYCSFAQWRQPARVLQLAHLLLVPRPPQTLPLPLPLPWGKRLRRKSELAQGSGGVYVWRCRPPPISAQECRRTLADGGEVRGLLAPAVAAHIRARGLYRVT